MTNFTLYKIYYGSECVYLGRTKQPVQTRLRGHFFALPMHKVIDIQLVNRVEICNCSSEADMYLYEIYYINLLKPTLNRDDKASDQLTVKLQELNFIEFEPKKMAVWKEKIKVIEAERQRELDLKKKKTEERRGARKNLTGEAWFDWLDKNS